MKPDPSYSLTDADAIKYICERWDAEDTLPRIAMYLLLGGKPMTKREIMAVILQHVEDNEEPEKARRQ